MLRKIQTFQTVVQLGSFTEAAEACHISQSAVSQQIQALERELGFALLERRGRSFVLTAAGEYFYQKSLALLADCQRICREAERIAKGAQASLRVGCLRSYGGDEFYRAVGAFAEKYPRVSIQIEQGNHEELYQMLRTEAVDLVLNDQRRAFSEVYVNLILTTAVCCVELSVRSPLAGMNQLEPAQLRDIPCILVCSREQRRTEQEYYREVVGFQGEFLYADNLEAAKLLVAGGKGFLPVEGGESADRSGAAVRVPLARGGCPITRNYCAFWKKDNSGYYIEEFAELLRRQFEQ